MDCTEEEKEFILSNIEDIKWNSISDSLKLFWIEELNNQKKSRLVSRKSCKHCSNTLCDSQLYHEQCFKCGRKPQ